ncbi:glycosyltransferase family 2 protein [Thermodesulfobacteriota bacterium B35]
MPARITPCHRLPPHPARQGEGGLRLRSVAVAADGGRPRPELSVVTVTLDPGPDLDRTMRSVLQWDPARVEYIVIDGGSADGTLRTLREMDQRLEYWVSEPDAGISEAFNKGISLCRGTIVGLLNAGDWYEPHTLDAVRSILADRPEAGVLCGDLQYWQGREPACRCEARPELLPTDMTVTHPATFVRRSVYLEHGGFDESFRLAMDYELLLRLHRRGVPFLRTGRVLANMQHQGLAEKSWHEALLETHRARRLHMADSFRASPLYLRYLVARRSTRFLLQAMGLHGVVNLYRERIAPVRKTRTRDR